MNARQRRFVMRDGKRVAFKTANIHALREKGIGLGRKFFTIVTICDGKIKRERHFV